MAKTTLRANASAASRANAAAQERDELLAAYNAADPKEKDTIARMVAVGVESALDSAMVNFKARPHGDYWRQLEDAMWAWQGWQSASGADRLILAFSLRDVGIGKWIKTLATQHREHAIDI